MPVSVLIFIQATGEELLFRGYLLQNLAARYRHWLIWAFLPSALFGAFHFFNSDDPTIGALWAVSTTITGLLFCTLLWRTGTLWLPIILHVANNTYAFLIVSIRGDLDPFALFVHGNEGDAELFLLSIIPQSILIVLILSPFGNRIGPGGRHEIEDKKTAQT